MKDIIIFLVEAVTVGTAVFLAGGIDSNIFCGVAALALSLLFCAEKYIWEEM